MKERNRSFDVLRGVAIMLVLGRHYDYRYIRIWHSIGWAGVDLFFVLSGFLISGLLFSEYKNTGNISIKRFWTRRAFKIYPPFYTLILLTIIYCLLIYKSVPREVLGDIFFLQNYAPRLWGHGWSLAIEEHFYVVLPLLLAAMVRISKNKENPFRAIPIISVLLTVLCLFLRISASQRTVHWEDLAFPTHLRVDALFAGVTLGYYDHFDSAALRVGRRLPVLLAGILVALPAFLFEGTTFTTTIGLTFTFIGCSCILIFALNRERPRNPALKLVAWIGRYSYSIYLWHALPALYVFDKLPQNPLMCVAYFSVCVAFGVVMAKLIEVPALRLRDRYFPSWRSQEKRERVPGGPDSELRMVPCAGI
jgi:peptidoglycan/LPS O-acetylase OafA/YrhL